MNAHLLLDLPRGFSPGWQPLFGITGSKLFYDAFYEDFEEQNVVKFLVGDTRNPGSIISSVAQARDKARTNAGPDQVATYSKLRAFGGPGRQIVVLSAGNLATTQAVMTQLKRGRAGRRSASSSRRGDRI